MYLVKRVLFLLILMQIYVSITANSTDSLLSDISNNDKIALNQISELLTTQSDSIILIELLFEKAKILYRLGRYQDVKDILKSIEKSSANSITKCNVKLYNGLVEKSLGNFSESMDYLLTTIDCFKNENDALGVNSAKNNIALIYYYQKKYLKAIKIWEELYHSPSDDHTEKTHKYLLNIGAAYHQLKDYDKAIKYYKLSLNLAVNIKDTLEQAMCYQNLGTSYNMKEDFITAEHFYSKSIEILKQQNNVKSLSELYFNIAGNYIETDIDKAYYYAQNSLNLAMKTEDLELLSDAYFAMYNVYSKKNKYKNAFDYLKKYHQIREKILNEKSINKVAELEAVYENEKKINTINTLNKEKLLQQKELQQKEIVTYFLISIVVIILLFLIYFFISFKQKKRANLLLQDKNKIIQHQKHLVEEKHKEITDSINYAERIQRSFLATSEMLENNLKDYFVFFRPKDVVSGDFYWASELNNGNFVLCCADSTGHGVPGAIMSILNISSLEKSIETQTEPHHILSETRKIIINRLKKDGSEQGGKDGMDCSLMVINYDKTQMSFASAHNPIIIIRNQEILEFKGDKMPVGKHDNDNEPFKHHIISLKKNDTIYTFTDGFPDQFGGPKNKKYMSKNLKKLLLQIAHLSMSEQKIKLSDEFNQWKGENEQVDDVCIIGVRI